MKVFLKQVSKEWGKDSQLRLQGVIYGFDVCTNLRTVGDVTCIVGRKDSYGAMHIDAVILQPDVRGQGITRQILDELQRRFQPDTTTLYAASLELGQSRRQRKEAQEKLVKHWERHGFALLNHSGTLMVKRVASDNVSTAST